MGDLNYAPSVEHKEEAVYNLQVENNNEFFANGVLVHNCDSLALCVSGIKEIRRRNSLQNVLVQPISYGI